MKTIQTFIIAVLAIVALSMTSAEVTAQAVFGASTNVTTTPPPAGQSYDESSPPKTVGKDTRIVQVIYNANTQKCTLVIYKNGKEVARNTDRRNKTAAECWASFVNYANKDNGFKVAGAF